MNRFLLPLLLVVLAVVIGAIVLLVPGTTESPLDAQGQAAVPGLEDRVNDLERLTVTGAGGQVIATLVRSTEGWGVQELSDYPVQLETLREVLGDLAQAEIMEPKTNNPAYYDRLGVGPVANADAGGLRLDLATDDGAEWAVIVGDEAPTRKGHYLRLADAEQSVLARFEANIPTDAVGWVDSKVVDLMSAEVAEVQVTHGDGEVITASKTSADDTDFTLEELPEGRELISAWSVNSLGSALSTLDFEAVRPADEFEWQDASQLRAVRFDGLVVTAHLLRDETAGDWVRVEVDTPYLGEATEAEADAGADDLEQAASQSVRESADAMAARTAGWAYRIPGYKADAMVPRLEELFKEPGSS